MVKRKISIKKINKFTKIAMNFVQEYLKTKNFIVQHSRHRKDDESSETKFNPPEHKKRNCRTLAYETLKHFAMVKKFLRLHLRKKFSTVFHKLNTKSG